MTGRAGFEPLWRALSQPDYRAYTLGQAFNNIGICDSAGGGRMAGVDADRVAHLAGG